MPLAFRTLMIAHALLLPVPAVFGQYTIDQQRELSGTLVSVSSGKLSLQDDQEVVWSALIAASGEKGVVLSDGVGLHYETDVNIRGVISPSELRSGQVVGFVGLADARGRTSSTIEKLELMHSDTGLSTKQSSRMEGPYQPFEFVARIKRVSTGKLARLRVEIERTDALRNKTLTFRLGNHAEVSTTDNDHTKLTPGTAIERLVVDHIRETDDWLVRELEARPSKVETIQIQADAKKRQAKYGRLSAQPQPPWRMESRKGTFVFLTDISPREAAIIGDKLEYMFSELRKYFGTGPTQPVTGFIVRDLDQWSSEVLVDPVGVAKIRRGEGVCFMKRTGSLVSATLYSCDDHGVIQHECVHAFCHLTFGSAGPKWLAEGVAELGNYWQAHQLAIEIDPRVMGYLQNARQKPKLTDIAIPEDDQVDTWQDYAWRWALCRLLAYNPNYQDRFKPLAIALMQQQEGVSFRSVYGPVARQISFEFDLFLENIGNGYREDLTAWQWNVEPLPVTRPQEYKVLANRGWQVTPFKLSADCTYDTQSSGHWKLSGAEQPHSADGDAQGRGSLIGAIYHDFKLSAPMHLGTRTKFTPDTDGQLCLRCQEDWTELADNEGEILFSIREHQ